MIPIYYVLVGIGAALIVRGVGDEKPLDNGKDGATIDDKDTIENDYGADNQKSADRNKRRDRGGDSGPDCSGSDRDPDNDGGEEDGGNLERPDQHRRSGDTGGQ